MSRASHAGWWMPACGVGLAHWCELIPADGLIPGHLEARCGIVGLGDSPAGLAPAASGVLSCTKCIALLADDLLESGVGP